MVEYLANVAGTFDAGDKFHSAPQTRQGRDVDVEHALESLCLRLMASYCSMAVPRPAQCLLETGLTSLTTPSVVRPDVIVMPVTLLHYAREPPCAACPAKSRA